MTNIIKFFSKKKGFVGWFFRNLNLLWRGMILGKSVSSFITHYVIFLQPTLKNI